IVLEQRNSGRAFAAFSKFSNIMYGITPVQIEARIVRAAEVLVSDRTPEEEIFDTFKKKHFVSEPEEEFNITLPKENEMYDGNIRVTRHSGDYYTILSFAAPNEGTRNINPSQLKKIKEIFNINRPELYIPNANFEAEITPNQYGNLDTFLKEFYAQAMGEDVQESEFVNTYDAYFRNEHITHNEELLYIVRTKIYHNNNPSNPFYMEINITPLGDEEQYKPVPLERIEPGKKLVFMKSGSIYQSTFDDIIKKLGKYLQFKQEPV
ncbi:MAG: hypothetical protein KKF44_09645, partial [Nanoarchaeota archaeon]|nr:hypothetical protein [Nanoarchaeota archaeon]